jgi:hypothetical protein
MEAVYLSETSLNFHLTIRRHISEDCTPQIVYLGFSIKHLTVNNAVVAICAASFNKKKPVQFATCICMYGSHNKQRLFLQTALID